MFEPANEQLAQRLRAHVEHLAGDLGERNPQRYGNLEAARGYIGRTFAEAGYKIDHDEFQVSGRTYRNVIAEVTGDRSAPLLVVGAHYDTAQGTPGADDNASGVASLLELARLSRHSRPRLTLRWVAFTLEEPPWFQSGLMGSRVHAKRCRARRERIVGMASLEMVGYYRDEAGSQQYPLSFLRWFYPEQGNFIAVAGNFASRRFVGRLARALAPSFHVASTALPFVPGVDLSDNWSFWQEGYPAGSPTQPSSGIRTTTDPRIFPELWTISAWLNLSQVSPRLIGCWLTLVRCFAAGRQWHHLFGCIFREKPRLLP